MSSNALFQQALNVLEWHRVLDILERRARSAMGAEFCRGLFLESDLHAARTRLQETTEMAALDASRTPFPSLAFPDVREALRRAAKGAVLEAQDLRDLSLVLGVAREVIRYLDRVRDHAPALAVVAEPLREVYALASIKDWIDRCIDPEGNIRESATPDLSRLMRQAHDLKQIMRHRLETILASRRYAEIIQEQYFAQREGRYVIPVKAEMRSKIPGIVHDVSHSGATVFLEPRELVELNNSIKVAELEVEREVRRILQELSSRLAGRVEAIQTGLDTLAALDCIGAKAAFSRSISGQPVALNLAGRVALKKARHPLLVLAKDHVVANDVMMDESVRVLIISGPNTGGKTVTLKIIGLFALMVRAGLHLPCGAESEMALFPEVYADIGDAQDLTKDLSSFSAHMTQMIRLLKETASFGPHERRTTALVLLDELVTSTDPTEGAALAEALLRHLAGLGMKVVVTTHYNALKAMAQTTPGFMNASVGFDVGTLSPTYRVLMGLPGGSSAIEIAGRLGMDEGILEDARRLLRREDLAIEDMLSDLQGKQHRLDEDLTAVTILKAEAARAAQEAAEIAERLADSEREERRRVTRRLTEELLRARAQVQTILDELKTDKRLVKAKEAKQRLAGLERQTRRDLLPATESIPVEQLRAGDRVEIISLGTGGTLLESPQGKKRVRVRVGDREMSIAASLLVGRTESMEAPAGRVSGHSKTGMVPPIARSAMDVPTAVDVRGKMAEEAVDLVVQALDRCALAELSSLRIIHGHGTGKLKAALRAYLGESPYVASFRAGERAEGGDGVTVVQLK